MNDTMNKTFGEQSGSAKSHLDTVQVNNHKPLDPCQRHFYNSSRI